MRHTFASNLARLGVPQDARARWLGHGVKVNDRYTHDRDQWQAAVDRME